MEKGRRPKFINLVEDQRMGKKLVPDLRNSLADFLRRHVSAPQFEEYPQLAQCLINKKIVCDAPVDDKGLWIKGLKVSETKLKGVVLLESGNFDFSLTSTGYPFENDLIRSIDFNLQLPEIDTELAINIENAFVESISRRRTEMGYVPVWGRGLTNTDYKDFVSFLDWVEENGILTPEPHRISHVQNNPSYARFIQSIRPKHRAG